MGDARMLLTRDEVVRHLVSRLDGQRGEKSRLAASLGITRIELSDVLAGRAPVRPGIAYGLGFRKVVMFEPIGQDRID